MQLSICNNVQKMAKKEKERNKISFPKSGLSLRCARPTREGKMFTRGTALFLR